MSDLKISWDTEYMEGDLSPTDNDLENEDGLETAVLLSLFVDRRANDDDELPDIEGSKRGWWGDQVKPVIEGDQIGSRLWLLERSKTLEEVLPEAKELAMESLLWMIEDGVAAKVEIEVERITNEYGTEILALDVNILKTEGTTFSRRYETQWNAQTS